MKTQENTDKLNPAKDEKAAKKEASRLAKAQRKFEKKERKAKIVAEEKAKEADEKLLSKKRDLVYKDIVSLQKQHASDPKVAPKDCFLSLQHINKIYANHVQAVFDFSLDVKPHEFIVLVGPSGCGKSTTLRMVAGLESITSGDLYIDGTYSNDLEPKDRHVAMVFQNYALYPHMSVYDNMAFGLKMAKVPRDEIDNRVKDVAKKLQLTDYLDRKPGELSGGQCQRVALGRAIIRNCRLFLMDEPLSNLDAKLRVQMRSEIVALHDTFGATTLYVTHDQTEAMTMATRIVVMKAGYIQQIGTPKEVYDKPSNTFVATFIGSPAMNILGAYYDNGTISFKNGFSLKLPESFIKGHDAFYPLQLQKIATRLGKLKAELAKPDLPSSIRELDEKEKETLEKRAQEFNDIVLNKRHAIAFGIRPEDIVKAGAQTEATSLSASMKVSVVAAEFLGKEYFIHTIIGPDHLIAKIGATKDVNVHDEISLTLDIDKIHLFDISTTLYIPVC
jgi:multiple sugar transport system ATP-binding protein